MNLRNWNRVFPEWASRDAEFLTEIDEKCEEEKQSTTTESSLKL